MCRHIMKVLIFFYVTRYRASESNCCVFSGRSLGGICLKLLLNPVVTQYPLNILCPLRWLEVKSVLENP